MKILTLTDAARGFFRYPVSMETIRLLIVDDLPQVRQGLAEVLPLAARKETVELVIIGQAQDGQEALRLAAELHPEVILMDVEMPGMNGVDATRQLRLAGFGGKIILLTIHTDQEHRRLAWEAGADCYVTKDTGYEVLLAAVLSRNGTPGIHNSNEGEKK